MPHPIFRTADYCLPLNRLLWLVVLSLGFWGAAISQTSLDTLSVERLVSMPTLSGTPPGRPVWSPDGRQLAFVWNEHGGAFRDLYLYDLDESKPRRLTDLSGTGGQVAEFGQHLVDPSASTDVLIQESEARHRTGIAQFVWSADSRSLYFNHAGQVHLLRLSDGHTEVLIESPAVRSQLQLSPDGRFLSFLQDGDLWLYRFDGGYLARATQIGLPGIGQVPIGAFNARDREYSDHRWSADGRYIALHHVDRRDVHRMPIPSYLHSEPILHEVRRGYPGQEGLIRKVGIYDTADGLVRYLPLDEPTRRTVLTLSWSPVANVLLIQQDSYDGEHRWLFTASAEERLVRQIHHDHRPRRIYAMFNAAWSSDGQQVIMVSDHEAWYQLYSLPAAGGPLRRLTRGDFDVTGGGFAATPLRVSAARGELFFASTEASPYEINVYRMPERGGRVQRVTLEAGTHEQWSVATDGEHIAVVSSSDSQPGELFVVASDSGEARRITHSPLPAFDDFELLQPHYVSFPSRADDFTLHARILLPSDIDPGKTYPVIIGNVYSGTARNQWTWPRPISLLQQMMASQGEYIIVQTDLRGSVGYGVEFREAFQGDWGGGDLDDLHSTVDYLKTLPYVDPQRIGIWGNSYGGMMVLFALFERPGLFAAGIAGSPAIDPFYFTQNDQHLSRRPQTHPEIFARSSLLTRGDRLEDPLLIIHGLHDDIVPFKTTVDLLERLMLQGKDFEMIVPPQSGHWWAYPEHYAVHTFRRFMQFFEQHVGSGGRPRLDSAED